MLRWGSETMHEAGGDRRPRDGTRGPRQAWGAPTAGWQPPAEWAVSRLLATLRARLPEIQARYQVRALWLSGSYVRNEQMPDSDVDVLVEFTQNPGVFKYVEFRDYLADLLDKPVDLVERSALQAQSDQYGPREIVAI